MIITDLDITMIVGLALSLVVSEVFGVVPGGMIVPGYLALVCHTPLIPVFALFIALTVFFLAKYVVAKIVILYGRRRFVAHIILSILITLILQTVFPILSFTSLEYEGIGAVVPALIANCFYRQGIKLTVISLVPVVLLTYGAMLLYRILI